MIIKKIKTALILCYLCPLVVSAGLIALKPISQSYVQVINPSEFSFDRDDTIYNSELSQHASVVVNNNYDNWHYTTPKLHDNDAYSGTYNPNHDNWDLVNYFTVSVDTKSQMILDLDWIAGDGINGSGRLFAGVWVNTGIEYIKITYQAFSKSSDKRDGSARDNILATNFYAGYEYIIGITAGHLPEFDNTGWKRSYGPMAMDYTLQVSFNPFDKSKLPINVPATSVPEPSSFAIMLLALLSLAFSYRKSRIEN